MSVSLQDAFQGCAQETHSQAFCLEGVSRRYTSKSVVQTLTFEGLDDSTAHSTGDFSVTDVGGTSYAGTLKSTFTDASSGTMVFPTEQVRVSRAHMSPHMWRVTVQREGTCYYLNGEILFHAPAWAIATGEAE